MSDDPKDTQPMSNPTPDDTPKFVDKRRRGIDRAFFKPMLPPTKPVQQDLPLGRRKP